MADYKQGTVSGTKWQRCNRVQIINDYSSTPYIIFGEEQIISIDGEAIRTQPIHHQCTSTFSPEGVIALRDPTTGNLTGGSLTHVDLYQALYSLYIETATARDAQVAVVQP